MSDSIVFEGTLKELGKKVDKGELIPKLQAPHALPCKFWTAYAVINGIKHCVPLVYGPTGCMYSVSREYKIYTCNYKGCPFDPPHAPTWTKPVLSLVGKANYTKLQKKPRKSSIPISLSF